MKKKWFRSLDLVDEKYIQEANPARGVTPLQTKRIVMTVLASCACFALIVCNLWLFLPYDKTPADVEPYAENEYYAVIEKLSALKTEPSEYNNNFQMIVDGITDRVMDGAAINGKNEEAVPEDAAPGGGASNSSTQFGSADSAYEEITDNQVEGITEADRIKRSSTHIYYLDDNTLKIFNIAGLETQEVGSITLDETAYSAYMLQWEFYLSADCRTATVLARYQNEQKKLCVGVISVDVSDPAKPVEKNRLEITGNYLSSRVTDGKILLMTEFVVDKYTMNFDEESTFLPQINGQSIAAANIILPEDVNSARYTVVMQLDENTLAVEGEAALLSYSKDAYVSQNYVFLTHVYADVKKQDDKTVRNSMTEITCLSYKDGFEKKGTAVVRGYVKDQWSMDEYEGVLRVVTTTNATTVRETESETRASAEILVTATGNSNASLYCVDLENFTVAASVADFAPPGEEVRSVRFDKTTAYVCTAIEVSDPVYFFDLSDLGNITYKDTGNIEGFSSSLINMGNGYLLGIGQENWDTFKVEIYKETETDVESICQYTLNNAVYSQEYKSYYIDRENQLVGLGVVDYNRNSVVDYTGGNKEYSRYILLHFDGYNLVELLNVELPGENEVKRGVYIDGFMYLFGKGVFKVEKIY